MRRFLLCAMVMLIAPAARSQVAPVPYSGQLSESGALVNGTRYFSIVVYPTASGGSAIYAQAESLVVTGGIYSTRLNADASVWNGDRWIGVSVNSGPELMPRVKLGYVPAAARAIRADTALFAIKPAAAGVTTNSNPAFANNLTTTTWVAVDSVTITPPADGQVFALATGEVNPLGSSGADLLVLQAPLAPPAPSTRVSSTVQSTLAFFVSGQFSGFAGAPIKVRLWARNPGFPNAVNIAARSMTLQYFPASY
jgi:hypothetical protein